MSKTVAVLYLVLGFCAPQDVFAQRKSFRLAGPVERAHGENAGEDGGRAGKDSISSQGAGLVIDPADLTGEKGAQAAHALLKAIQTGEGSIAERHRRFLARILSPEALVSGQESWVSALSIAQELRSWIPREGLPYEELSADLLPLIGLGAPEFRRAVIQAVSVLVTYEKEKSGPASSTLEELKVRLSNQAPTENFLRDAAAILWENDPRAALSSLVTALEFYSGEATGDTMMWVCLEELRARVSVYFPTPEAWTRWWKRVERLPLEEVLVDYQRSSEARFAAHWRRILERLKETQDADRVLLAIRGTLQANSVELRLAAVTALGEYAQWVLEIPLRGDQDKDSREVFLKRGAEALLAVIEREQAPLEVPAVIEAALASIRMYQGLGETAPEVHERLSEVVVDSLKTFSRKDSIKRGTYLETVRVAGALGVTAALPYIQGYLTSSEAEGEEDLEFLSSAVVSLGRLVDGVGMSQEMASLLIRCFRQQRPNAGKAVQDLRLVCMIALERGASNPEIRKRLLEFYKEVLAAHQDTVLPVRAVLGLGTLVKAKEAEALQTMVDILRNREQYSLDAVLAVVDSIASYVSPPEALHRFLPFLITQEEAIHGRLWSKVLSLVESGGLPNAALASRELLMLGLETGNSLFLESAESLFEEAPLKALLDPQKLDLASRRQVSPWWNTMLHLVRIHDLRRQYGGDSGADDPKRAKMAMLGELLRQNEALRREHPDEVKEFEQLAAAFQKRRDLLPRIAAPEGFDATRLVAAFGELLRIETSPIGRRAHLLWIERQLAAIKSVERLTTLRDSCLAFLREKRNADIWEGLPEALRGRAMARLKNLTVASPPPPSPPEKDEKES